MAESGVYLLGVRALLRRLLRPPPPPRPAPPPTRTPSPLPALSLPPRGRTLADYAPADPAAWRFTAEDLDPALRDAHTETALRALLTPIDRGLWALRPVSPSWACALRDEVRRLSAWARLSGIELAPPNSMNQYGVICRTMGLDLARLREALNPLTALLYGPHGGGRLDHEHAFVVRYALGEDLDLGFHADDAEVTLNLCLGDGFAGGDLYFEGERCERHRQTPSAPGERLRWTHQPGVALLHAGANRHGAHAITHGERHNLIVWMRASADRLARESQESVCPPWCEDAMRAG